MSRATWASRSAHSSHVKWTWLYTDTGSVAGPATSATSCDDTRSRVSRLSKTNGRGQVEGAGRALVSRPSSYRRHSSWQADGQVLQRSTGVGHSGPYTQNHAL